ncbi:MAG TPA: type ISP restriction/modification enzyme [Tepidisphaeraceae bacterium]|nr:type ISP restriction/modification enzyme [Tepidisphaeraceae bacterium]
MAEHAGEFDHFISLGAGPLSAEPGETPVIFSSSQAAGSLPRPKHEYGNVLICVAGTGESKGFGVLARQVGQSLDLPFDDVRCFPFYTYNEDGSIRRENITDGAMARFSKHYNDPVISKWSIFDYVYGVLHHPAYPSIFADDLKHDSPRIPFAPSFRDFQRAGQKLIELHLHSDKLEPWQIEVVQIPKRPPGGGSARPVGPNADKTTLPISPSLALAGIPPEAFEYRLGDRPAVEWLLEKMLVNDRDRPGDPQQIARLVGQWVRMSLETVNLVRTLPALLPAERRP